MLLSPGHRIGSYTITGSLGSGGMGEVYRARDATLEREIAIKVLSGPFARRPDRVSRFEREARTLASLNHPNIAQVYAIERLDGHGDDRHEAAAARSPLAIIMELVEGPTLQEVLLSARRWAPDAAEPSAQRRGLELPEALAIARQIADGLDAAHEGGIVHRDLKPANIKLRPDGVVKILDFGLAKIVDTPGADADSSPTVTAASAAGVILGTAAYMSPEQARGEPVDKRTDIWAFGCVLYEMLTGHRAFGGTTVSDVIAAVLRGEPDWARLPSGVPPEVARILRRALDKDRRRRLRDIGDVRLDSGDEDDGGSVQTPESRGRANWTIGLGIAFAAMTLVAGVQTARLLMTSDARAPAGPVRTSIMLPPDQRIAEGLLAGSGPSTSAFVLSPDGTTLVYGARVSGAGQLFTRDMASFEVRALPGTDGGNYPFFSPDSQWLGFVAQDRLMKVRLSGGAPVPICDVGSIGRGGGTWLDDGTIVFSAGPSPVRLWRVRDSGGTPEPLTEPESGGHTWPHTWPGSDAVIFRADGGALMALSLASKTVTPLGITGAKQPRVLPTGHLVYAVEGAVLAVRFDRDRLQVIGSPVPVLDVPVFDTSNTGGTYYTISDTGTLAYVPGGINHRLVWVDRAGNIDALPFDAAGYRYPALSPTDERYISVTIDPADNGPSDIWTLDAQTGRATKLTDDGHQLYQVWTTDGHRIAYNSEGRPFWQPFDQPGTGVPLPGAARGTVQAIAADGAWFVQNPSDPVMNWDLYLGRRGENEPVALAASRFREKDAELSLDERWLAFESDENLRPEVWVQPFPRPGRRVQASIGGGENPVWSQRELFYLNGADMMAAPFTTTSGSELPDFGRPVRLFSDPSLVGHGNEIRFDVTRDGQRFLMVQNMHRIQGAKVALIQNWFGELERLTGSR